MRELTKTRLIEATFFVLFGDKSASCRHHDGGTNEWIVNGVSSLSGRCLVKVLLVLFKCFFFFNKVPSN